MLDTLLRDLRHAARGLMKSPGFTAVAVVSLALGLGLNTALFTIVNAVLLRPLPVERPDRLAAIFTTGDNGGAYSSSSYPDYADLASTNTTLDGLAAHSLMMAGVERPGAVTRLTLGEIVSPNYFDVLGVKPTLGRAFQPGDERPTAAPTMVIGDRMWQRDFGRSSTVLGQGVVIRGRTYTIVGVAPAGFDGLASGVSAEMWIPAGRVDDVEPMGVIDTSPSATGSNRIERRGQRWLFLTGRLKDGVTLSQARDNMKALMATFARTYPVSNQHRGLTVLPASAVRIHPDVDSALTPASIVLMAAVGLVLLVACANLATMLLARATSRSREMAVRLAIGASRLQLVRQLLVESMLLSTLGGVAGLLLALWATRAISAMRLPLPVSVAFDFTIDARVALFTFALSITTGAVFGLVPALRASRPNLIPALKGETDSAGARRFSLRNGLVAGQMALSMALLVIAGLMLRSFVSASHADVGFDPSRLTYAAIDGGKQFDNEASMRAFYDAAETRLRALPGVTAVTRTDRLPFALTANTNVIEIDGVHGPAPDGGVPVDVASVGASYFDTMGIRVLRGRAFDSRDTVAGQLVAIVNETAARKYWPGRDVLGQRFEVKNGAFYTIVGVSADHVVRTVGETPRPFVQFALDQERPSFVSFVARTNGPAVALVAPIRRTLTEIEPRLAFMGLEPLSDLEDATLIPARAGMILLGVFGSLALVLAAIGLYGVMAFNVSRRTRDIGIRMALGAEVGRVQRDVVRDALWLVGAGGVAGLVLAAIGARAVGSMLVGIGAFDPLSFAAAALVLLATAVCASIIPARRAAKINPMIALRRG